MTNAVGHAACTLASDIRAKALLAITKSVYGSQNGKFRPETMIIAATPHLKTYHQMALLGGVYVRFPWKIFRMWMFWYTAAWRSEKLVFCRRRQGGIIVQEFLWMLQETPI